MSTRCYIGILRSDGTVESIYCHNDGYLDWTGYVLNNHYKDLKKIEELIKLGNISMVNTHISPKENQEHSFHHPQRDMTIAYARDRGDRYQKPRIHKNLNEFMKYFYDSMCVYVYLYDQNEQKWLTNYGLDYNELTDLETAIENHELETKNQIQMR